MEKAKMESRINNLPIFDLLEVYDELIKQKIGKSIFDYTEKYTFEFIESQIKLSKKKKAALTAAKLKTEIDINNYMASRWSPSYAYKTKHKTHDHLYTDIFFIQSLTIESAEKYVKSLSIYELIGMIYFSRMFIQYLTTKK